MLNIPMSIITLAIGSFGIGLAEFLIMGLLPEVAAGMNVSLSQAGYFISAYALGVVVGAPLLSIFGRTMTPKYKLIVLSDEIYSQLTFNGQYKSISNFYPEGTIVSTGLSKWCGAGGWRIGTLTFPQELKYIKDMVRRVASETYTSVSVPIQYAAIKAYTHNHENFLKHSRLILKFISFFEVWI